MEQETNTLYDHKTCKLLPRPKDRNVIECKWSYKLEEK